MSITVKLEYVEAIAYMSDAKQLTDPEMWTGMDTPEIDCDEITDTITIYCVDDMISKINPDEITFWNGNLLEFTRNTIWEVELEG